MQNTHTATQINEGMKTNERAKKRFSNNLTAMKENRFFEDAIITYYFCTLRTRSRKILYLDGFFKNTHFFENPLPTVFSKNRRGHNFVLLLYLPKKITSIFYLTIFPTFCPSKKKFTRKFLY